MPENHAAYLVSKTALPLEVKSAPYPVPGLNEILVKNGAVAINPVDWAKQHMGDLMLGYLIYPIVMGSDVAGEVVEVGQGVDPTQLKVGDRVVGLALGMDKRSHGAAEGGFQEYTVLRANLASPIPANMSHEKACVLPLALSTAACGLFMKDQLALQHPTVPANPTGETLVIWGGSTSVGCNAIQLAKAAGYEVITTASPKNFDSVQKLGASYAFDYHSPHAVKDIISLLKNKRCAGALAIGHKSTEACLTIVAASKGHKFVSQASGPFDLTNIPKLGLFSIIGSLSSLVRFNVSMFVKRKASGVGMKFIFSSDLVENEVGKAVFTDFLPVALANGDFLPAPESQVVGRGLESIQEALDVQKKGVSMKKIVVTL